MATQRDMDFTYTLIDRIFRLSIGETGDFSCALFDGDETVSLESAQRRKHEFIYESLSLAPGARVLDMGCGWGGLMRYLTSRGVECVGVTLSRGQHAACRRNGLDVHLLDCKRITRETFGRFDAVASLGAFEHFCSIAEWQEGRQAAVYGQVFDVVANVIDSGGRFFLQTMVFGRNMIPYEEMSVDAPRLSDGHVLALMEKLFPGSWLPYGDTQVLKAAEPDFTLVAKRNGRLDYIRTIAEWQRRFGRFTPRKGLLYLTLLPRYVFSRDFRLAFASGISANTICFERELMDHWRFVFQKR